ncbi:unnamed protein product [Durusdinium trenchii]|uniref:DNA (cytosine-5-)-methyltransferase n=1 Tax=Durusdinium trenchii TaxID=1381693 RepID=A0ABP0S8M2_9DINO
MALGRPGRGLGKPTAAQRDLLLSIELSAQRLLKDDVQVDWTNAAIREDFDKRSVSYTGEEVCKAEPLSLRRVIPGLPPEGHGGSIQATDWVDGRTRTLLEHPELCVTPDVGQELPRLQGKIHVEPEDRMALSLELVRRGICRWIPENKVAKYRGEKVLNGMFGVPKSKLLPEGQTILRLIMNLVPSNSILRVITGRVSALPSITQWLNVVVDEGETIRIAQSDMACAFYLFAMPECWSSYLAFNLSFTAAELPLVQSSDPRERWYLACRVLPMGWSSAVGVMQSIAEDVLLKGGFDPAGQVTKVVALPPWILASAAEGQLQGKPWWQVYLDNFAAGAKVKSDEAGELIRMQQDAEAIWQETSIVVSPGKVVAAESGVELGAFVGGNGQWLGASAERWPETVFHEDVRTLTKDVLLELLKDVGDFEAVHLWAGFPCVDVSSVRANRQNRSGPSSSLIHEAIRVFGDCAELFPEKNFQFFVENVASMDNEVRDQISGLLEVQPYRLWAPVAFALPPAGFWGMLRTGELFELRLRHLLLKGPTLYAEAVPQKISANTALWNAAFCVDVGGPRAQPVNISRKG